MRANIMSHTCFHKMQLYQKVGGSFTINGWKVENTNVGKMVVTKLHFFQYPVNVFRAEIRALELYGDGFAFLSGMPSALTLDYCAYNEDTEATKQVALPITSRAFIRLKPVIEVAMLVFGYELPTATPQHITELATIVKINLRDAYHYRLLGHQVAYIRQGYPGQEHGLNF